MSLEVDKILKLYFIELEYYTLSLRILDNNKPLFFMRKKIDKYNIERNELINKIELCKKRIKKIIK